MADAKRHAHETRTSRAADHVDPPVRAAGLDDELLKEHEAIVEGKEADFPAVLTADARGG